MHSILLGRPSPAAGIVVSSLADVTPFDLQEYGQMKQTLEDMLNGHYCYDKVNIVLIDYKERQALPSPPFSKYSRTVTITVNV